MWDLCDRLKQAEEEVSLSPEKLKYHLALVSVRDETGVCSLFPCNRSDHVSSPLFSYYHIHNLVAMILSNHNSLAKYSENFLSEMGRK